MVRCARSVATSVGQRDRNQERAEKMAYAISTNEEDYQGKYDTIEEALEEAVNGYAYESFWLGTCRAPRQPEKFIDADGMLDAIGDGHEDWGGDWAEWDKGTFAQIDELQKEFEAVMSAWLDRHKLRPHWFCIDEAVKYVVVDGVAQLASAVQTETEWHKRNGTGV
jgi:hypothetical protein